MAELTSLTTSLCCFPEFVWFCDSLTQQVHRKHVLVLITMMAANNLDLRDAKEESCSPFQFQEVNCLKMQNLSQFRIYIPTIKEGKN